MANIVDKALEKVPGIEKPQTIIDNALQRVNAGSKKIPLRKDLPLADKKRKNEFTQIKLFSEAVNDYIEKYISQFPTISMLSPFSQELIDTMIGIDKLKVSLAQVRSITKRINSFKRDTKTFGTFLGRASSVINKAKPHLSFLHQARRTLRKLPLLKTLPTVCLFGFPNVGKTTLLAALTGAKAEIAAYEFTTKYLNLGTMTYDGYKVLQCIDTPGTLARPDKMNQIEKIAYTALNKAADVIVFIYDPTRDDEEQQRLLTIAKATKKPLLIYISKTDIAKKPTTIEGITDKEKLKEAIINEIKKAPPITNL
ncbi:MAG: 50S ribosome-binding GTPase [Candidatus Woesearchaeota archaeon]|nr:MAG: 50S ribosome-binding GTPase [Candidatus Woesearchaeota archaeon]